MTPQDDSHNYSGNNTYCWDFNADGYCKTCGATRLPSLDQLGEWPTGTWFQKRLAFVVGRKYGLPTLQS